MKGEREGGGGGRKNKRGCELLKEGGKGGRR